MVRAGLMAMAQLGEGTDVVLAEFKGIEGTQRTERRIGKHLYHHQLIVFTITYERATRMCSLALTPPRPHPRCWRACTPVALGTIGTSALTSEGPPRPPRA